MNRIHTIGIRRLAGVLAGLASALLASVIAAPAAFASTSPGPVGPAPADFPPVRLPPLPPGWNKHPPLPAHAHAVVAGGMPGWQMTLVAIGAVLLAAALAVLLARARTARRRAVASPA
jgi:hypothetical protein